MPDEPNGLNGDTSDEALTEEDIPRIEELLRQYEELAESIRETEADLKPHLDQILQELAGPYLESMLASQKETISYLAHDDSRLRRAAVWLAHWHWKITTPLAREYETIALEDSDSAVRAEAITALGFCYSLTRNPRIGRLLASFIRDETLPESFRLNAFCSLDGIHGWYPGKTVEIPTSLQGIDWSLVDRYYNDYKRGRRKDK
jgi:HEAT repeat protein